MSDTITLEAIRDVVLKHRKRLPAVTLAPSDALGLVLAKAIVATESLPRFTNSAMDGYALRSKDTLVEGVLLDVVGSTMAGEGKAALGPGQAVRIMTGAPLPDGADAVCMFEETFAKETRVHIPRVIPPGANVRLPGEDVSIGMEVFTKGTILGPAHLGVLAGLGERNVLVHRRPVVGVLSSGDELVAEGATLGSAQIRDVNRPALLALVSACGARPVDLGIVGDNERTLMDVIQQAIAGCDVLITSGGASNGDRDTIATVLKKLTGSENEPSFRIAIRPAKPFVFAEIGDPLVPVFGLPGNPVSALVAFELIVKPALRKLAGHRVLIQHAIAGIAESDFIRRPDGKVHYVRAHAQLDESGVLRASLARGQGAHMLLAMAESNALVVLRDGNGVSRGGRVQVLLMTGETC